MCGRQIQGPRGYGAVYAVRQRHVFRRRRRGVHALLGRKVQRRCGDDVPVVLRWIIQPRSRRLVRTVRPRQIRCQRCRSVHDVLGSA